MSEGWQKPSTKDAPGPCKLQLVRYTDLQIQRLSKQSHPSRATVKRDIKFPPFSDSQKVIRPHFPAHSRPVATCHLEMNLGDSFACGKGCEGPSSSGKLAVRDWSADFLSFAHQVSALCVQQPRLTPTQAAALLARVGSCHRCCRSREPARRPECRPTCPV